MLIDVGKNSFTTTAPSFLNNKLEVIQITSSEAPSHFKVAFPIYQSILDLRPPHRSSSAHIPPT